MLMTDAVIEARRKELEPLIGPTRAGWHAEACKVEHGDPALLWACRYREMANEAGLLEQQIAALTAERGYYAREALVALAGAGVCTPEAGYVNDGGPSLMGADIRRLAAQRDALTAELRAVVDFLRRIPGGAGRDAVCASAEAVLARAKGGA